LVSGPIHVGTISPDRKWWLWQGPLSRPALMGVAGIGMALLLIVAGVTYLVLTNQRVIAQATRAITTQQAEVTIVAPDREQSATSHSLTLHYPLRARHAPDGGWTVDGTPTDCVTLAVNALLPERPDVVLSGINHGPNMGEDVLYSGTVSAAMEATVLGIPAIAFSYSGDPLDHIEAWEGPVRRLPQRLPDLQDDGLRLHWGIAIRRRPRLVRSLDGGILHGRQ